MPENCYIIIYLQKSPKIPNLRCRNPEIKKTRVLEMKISGIAKNAKSSGSPEKPGSRGAQN